MKKHISLLTCFAALAFASCNDWLDVKPSTQIDREELLSTEKGYAEAIKGVYTRMCGASLYGREMTWGAMDILAGNYQPVSSPAVYSSIMGYGYVRGADNHTNDADDLVGRFWTDLYTAIAGINSLLSGIDEHKQVFSGDNYSVIKGEAVGLRAFLHFEVLRMFGDVYPKSKDSEVMPFVSDLSGMVSPMLTGREATDIIVAQLEEAAALLEKDPMRLGEAPSDILASVPSASADNNISAWHNRRFRFNYYAAKATLARVYLWRGEREEALRTALEVIAAQPTHFPWALTSNLTNIESGTSENQDRTFATEHVFALNVTDIESLIAGYLNSQPGNGVGRMFSMRDMFAGNDQGVDPRFRYMYTMYNAGNYMLSKFYQPSNVLSYFKFRLPLIRISEMYYIAAECAGDWRQGLEYLETVRRRRGMGSMPLGGVAGPAGLQDEIRAEYRKEFIGEGQLWFYYKRLQATSITNMVNFRNVQQYIFPRPENEDLYGGRD